MSTACHWFQGPSAFPGRRQDWAQQLTAAPCPVVISSSHCFQGAARSQAVSPSRCLLLDETPLGPWPGPRKLRSPTSLWTLSFLSFPHRRSKRKRPPSARQALGFWTLQGFLETAPSGSPSPNTINQGARGPPGPPFQTEGSPSEDADLMPLWRPAARPTPGVTHTFFYLCLSFRTWGRTTPFLPCSQWTSVSAVTKSLRLISV